MRSTPFVSSNTSIMGYILKMQELASRADIDEKQIIQFIIDGFQDRSASIAILYSARTIDELKKLAHRYAQLRGSNSAVNRPKNSASYSAQVAQHQNESKPKVKFSVVDSEKMLVQCYNCSGMGHFSTSCPHPKRQKGSCFRCGSTVHILKDCPKLPPKNARTIALIEEFCSGPNQDHSDVDALSDVKICKEVNSSDKFN
ncbi:uncharacterized protein LOC129942499 [Eupeodes corollae]|uniref:uncharacterized protein LOC129942499 n=1 Tax=Eupeodes corollae TaxID=290404 RepID=UPI00248F5AAE|nr:uncharacterized protein LOC129942499 [Eupeodes corollae]